MNLNFLGVAGQGSDSHKGTTEGEGMEGAFRRLHVLHVAMRTCVLENDAQGRIFHKSKTIPAWYPS